MFRSKKKEKVIPPNSVHGTNPCIQDAIELMVSFGYFVEDVQPVAVQYFAKNLLPGLVESGVVVELTPLFILTVDLMCGDIDLRWIEARDLAQRVLDGDNNER